jgi:2-keto-4-pentenoate hydratase/2-oxohepta-3-ene-1,7-dioic acid hydratase in catechol pathway
MSYRVLIPPTMKQTRKPTMKKGKQAAESLLETYEWFSSTRTIYAIGRNYVAHAKELNNAVPKKPFW